MATYGIREVDNVLVLIYPFCVMLGRLEGPFNVVPGWLFPLSWH